MTGVIAVQPKQQFLNNGEPVSGGSVTVYAANTTTPVNTWSDRAQTTLNANPIVLDAQGRCSIWLTQGSFYDFVIKDSLGATLYTVDDVAGALDSVTSTTLSEWLSPGNTPTFLSSTGFSLVGNQTATYSVGRRVKATISGGALVYGTIISSVFTSVTTVTLNMDSSSLDSGLSAVDVGIISYTNPSINSVIPLNLSSYSGSDLALNIGQSAIYDVSSITSLLLRIATGDNQEHRISIRPTNIAGATISSANLQPNNANTGAGAVNRQGYFNTNGAAVSPASASENNFLLCGGGTPYRITVECCTRTNGKSIESRFRSLDGAANNQSGIFTSIWSDTTTAWSSLGTLNFGAALSGRIMVTRLM